VLDLGDEFKVAAADELLAKLEQVFGSGSRCCGRQEGGREDGRRGRGRGREHPARPGSSQRELAELTGASAGRRWGKLAVCSGHASQDAPLAARFATRTQLWPGLARPRVCGARREVLRRRKTPFERAMLMTHGNIGLVWTMVRNASLSRAWVSGLGPVQRD